MVGTELVGGVNLGGTVFGAENFQSSASVKGGGTIWRRTYLRTLRCLDWEQQMALDDDLDRLLDSTEVLSEDLQVAIGSDLVSMYPNMDVDLVVEIIGEEVKWSGVKWTNVDWLEGARYCQAQFQLASQVTS